MKLANAFAALELAGEDEEVAGRRDEGASGSNKKKKLDDDELKDPLVWIDLEMTGLDLDTCTILEIACIITDGNMDKQIEGPNLVIHHSDDVLATMNEWCIEHHGESGLTQRVRESTLSMKDAEDQVLEFIKKYTTSQCCHIAGNTVHCDLAFIRKYMPRIAEHLHYRIVDISSIYEIARRWYPKELQRKPRKKCEHLALPDIRDSIEELRWFRKHIFKEAKKK